MSRNITEAEIREVVSQVLNKVAAAPAATFDSTQYAGRKFIGVFDEANVRNFVFAFSAGYSLILGAAFFYVKKDRKLNVASVVTAVSCAVLGLSVSLYGDILFSFFTVLSSSLASNFGVLLALLIVPKLIP